MRTLLATALTAAVTLAGAALAPAAQAHGDHHDRRIVDYTVRSGDTPSSLAVRFHAWTDELIARNGSVLRVGERIEIPVVVSAERKARTTRAPSRTAHLPDPSRAQVRRAITRHAHNVGVDPNLALAVAWQESGWQMDVISPAGAIGAMQVLRTTADWMEGYTGHSIRLRKLLGNAIAGTTLLRVLRENTGSQRHQIAANYQGLGAVQRHGLYDETVPYVDNVQAIKKRLDRGLPPR